jgi:hypothetical protein
MVMPCHQNAGQNHDLLIANKYFVGKFQVFGKYSSKSKLHSQTHSRLNSRNACCLSVQSLLSLCHLSKNLKIKVYKTIILPVVLYCCETWPLTLRAKHRLKVSENRVGEYLGLRGGSGGRMEKNCIMRSFITYTLHQLLLE